jgi:hypothetical protein
MYTYDSVDGRRDNVNAVFYGRGSNILERSAWGTMLSAEYRSAKKRKKPAETSWCGDSYRVCYHTAETVEVCSRSCVSSMIKWPVEAGFTFHKAAGADGDASTDVNLSEWSARWQATMRRKLKRPHAELCRFRKEG